MNALCVEKLSGSNVGDSSVLKQLKLEFGDELIGLLRFGSQVRGDALESSDDDYLIVLDSNKKLSRDLYRVWDHKISVDSKISPHFCHLPNDLLNAGGLWLECALNSDVIFDPSDLLRKSVKELLVLIASGHYLRKLSHGHPYWVKKEISHAE